VGKKGVFGKDVIANICTTRTKNMENLEIFALREFIFFNARLRRLAVTSALESTSIQTFEISETCVWHLSRH